MKKISLTLFAVIMVIAATLKASAQTEQTRQVSGFSSIASAGSFDVHVNIDGTETLKLSSPADLINDIETVVEGGKLEIRFKKDKEWTSTYGKINVYVTAKALSNLSISGSGYIKVDGVLKNDDVKLAITGSGNITANVKSTDLHATITGSGNITVDGSSESAHFVISGSGDMKAAELKAGSAYVSIAGSGRAHIYADKTITARISGSGGITYSGNASVTDFTAAGSGRISRENSK